MAITNVIDSNGVYTFYGLASDTKPTGSYPLESIFYEIDTKKIWHYIPGNTNPTTSDCWWEV